MRILGLDPGLRYTGWGVIDVQGNRLSHVANGAISTNSKQDLALRLCQIKEDLDRVLETYAPDSVAVEETLSNKNPSSTLKLGMARGTVIVSAALKRMPVTQYLPLVVKKSVVGSGHAAKEQVQMMILRLLPGCSLHSADAADALAVAVCHAHYQATAVRWQSQPAPQIRERDGL